ncbi:MAG TPA: SpoIIE family protein phosphatase [Coriobacteriia bacterium]
MVTQPSLLPLAAGILAAMLAAMAALVPLRRTPAILFFTLFNVATAVWTLTYFVQINWGHFADPALAPWGRPDSLLLVFTALSVSAAPTYWFLFAAADSHLRFWLSRPGLVLAHVPLAYTIVVGLTNPWTHLFLTTNAEGKLVPGPLAVPYYALTYGFVVAGTWLLVRHALASGTTAGRRQALMLALAPLVLLTGGVLYAYRMAIGAPLRVNPTPGLFAVLSLALAYQIVRSGLASIVPLSTLSSIMENTDAPLAYLDADFHFVSVNSAFLERSGHIEAELVGRNYFALFPDPSHRLTFDAVKRTGVPTERKADPTMLRDRSGRDVSYWNWSLSPVKRDGRGEIEGFVLSLVDVTDEVLARDLSNALDTLSVSLHAGFASDSTLCDTVSEASERLGCETATMVLRNEHGWRMMQGCGRTEVHWEPFDADVYQHIALALHRARTATIEDASADDRVTPSLMRTLGVRAALVVPLLFEKGAVGAVAFVDGSRPRHFGRVQMDFAQRFASIVTAVMENRRVYEGERRIAETLQESMLSMPQSVAGIDFAHCYRSATEAARVGGDFYDLFDLEDGRIAVLIGDIAGHGIEAAVATSLVKNTIRAHALDDSSPAEVMGRTNEIVRRQMEPGLFATACFSVLDRATGRLSYCNAGHPPTLIKTGAGEVIELTEHSTVLGVLPDIVYPQGEARLAPDDVLVLYTDGVIEARGRGGKQFGEDRLVELLAEEPAHEPIRVVDRIYDDVMSFTGNELSDDMALLAVRLDGTAGS